MRRSKAFTLLELMIVIVVVAIVAGLLLPLIVHKREMSRRAVCQANLKQIGLAVSMYSNDWKDWYPTTGVGVPQGQEEPLRSLSLLACCYGGDPQIFVCPSTNEQPQRLVTRNHRPVTFMTPKGCSYAYDHQKPPKTPPQVAIGADKPDPTSPGTRNSANHRNQGQNVLYFDCHAEWASNVSSGMNGDNIFTGNWSGPGGTLAATDTYCVLR